MRVGRTGWSVSPPFMLTQPRRPKARAAWSLRPEYLAGRHKLPTHRVRKLMKQSERSAVGSYQIATVSHRLLGRGRGLTPGALAAAPSTERCAGAH